MPNVTPKFDENPFLAHNPPLRLGRNTVCPTVQLATPILYRMTYPTPSSGSQVANFRSFLKREGNILSTDENKIMFELYKSKIGLKLQYSQPLINFPNFRTTGRCRENSFPNPTFVPIFRKHFTRRWIAKNGSDSLSKFHDIVPCSSFLFFFLSFFWRQLLP